MKFKTWLESVDGKEWTRENLIKEAPYPRFNNSLPPELSFLGGALTDLGFENFGLLPAEYRVAMNALNDTGIAIPNTEYKMRPSADGEFGVVKADGSEKAELPHHWKKCVLVMNNNNQFTWVGNKVRPEQVGKFDKSKYTEDADGWSLNVV